MSAEHPLPTNIIRSNGRKRPGVTSAVSATATSLRLISCIQEATPYNGPRIVAYWRLHHSKLSDFPIQKYSNLESPSPRISDRQLLWASLPHPLMAPMLR